MLVTGKIFISYRRDDDAGTTGRLSDELKKTFDADQLFLDVDSIEPGLDFVEVIEDRISKSDVLLAIIGEHWVDARDRDGKRRLDSPRDPVRLEIETAINQRKRVIPVLIGETRMPEAEVLPKSMSALAGRNAITIRNDRFRDDMANLTNKLRHIFGENGEAAPVGLFTLPDGRASSAPQWPLRGNALLGGIFVLLLGLAGGAYFAFKPVHSPDAIRPAATSSQPGWCQDANLSQAELRVCASPGLLALDKQLGDVYDGLKRKLSSDKAQVLSADEGKWLSGTRGPCAQDEACLYKAYQERIAYLENYAK
jgi:hypothetical protein